MLIINSENTENTNNPIPAIKVINTKPFFKIALFSSLVFFILIADNNTPDTDPVAKNIILAIVAIPLYNPASSGENQCLTIKTSAVYKNVIAEVDKNINMAYLYSF